jgi:hypothetical protein
MADDRQTVFQAIGRRLGLFYQVGGQPQAGPGKGPQAKSRYDRGLLNSRRLDEDIDDLRARIAALEQRLNADGR